MLFKPDRDLGGQLHLSAKRLKALGCKNILINILLFCFFLFCFFCVYVIFLLWFVNCFLRLPRWYNESDELDEFFFFVETESVIVL